MQQDLSPPRINVAIWTAIVIAAICIPTLIAFNLPPSATFFNQIASLIGWGSFLVTMTALIPGLNVSLHRGPFALLAPLAVIGAAAVLSFFKCGLPLSIALSALGMLVAAAATILAGAAVRRSDCAPSVFRAFCIALVLAGIAGAVIASIQVFLPDWADSTWIAAAPADGRASSNLRQPNHLSSLLLWSLVALAWLWQARTVPVYAGGPMAALLVFGVVLTGSRTGIVDVLILAAWGLLDRQMPRQLRVALALMPIFYAISWWGLTEWAHSTHHVFGGEARMGMQGDISSSRYAIWANTLSLIAQHPWFGVGFGEFNFAWSLTPFPHRPVAFFDHTHNLALQFAVELGLPLALLLLLSLLTAFWWAFRASTNVEPPMSAMIRAAFMIVLLISVHSMFEYPLWYAYFLLPTAFAFGFCLGAEPSDAASSAQAGEARRNGRSLTLAALGLACMIGGAATTLDYLRVARIFESGDGEPLLDRIEAGRRSVFFNYHADYAAVTVAAKPSMEMQSFATATHNLLDTRLMIAWAKAFSELGDLERAKHIAQRLREFRNEDAKDFFAPCEKETSTEPRPFQCESPTRAMDYRDFR